MMIWKTTIRNIVYINWTTKCIIKNFSNSELTLDFEGSMIPSIAKFMQDFGPIEKHYTNYSNLDFLTKKN